MSLEEADAEEVKAVVPESDEDTTIIADEEEGDEDVADIIGNINGDEET